MNFQDVPESVLRPGRKTSFVERRIRRIVNARSVTIGLAATFVGLALIGGVIIRFVDHQNFPSVGLGIWWALQTVTTVGYGDVTPRHASGRLVGVIVMLEGISFLAIITAAITSSFVARAEREHALAEDVEDAAVEARLNTRFDDLTVRFDRLESMLREEET